MSSADLPLFSAVSTSAHHLYALLRCIGFVPKATVQITPQGIRFSAEEGRVVQGLVFLEKALFTSYIFNPRAEDVETQQPEGGDDGNRVPDVSNYPRFMISLSALIETLQILGISDSSDNPTHNSASFNAFSTPSLFLNRTCTLSYPRQGSPLCITLNEASVTTTCELTTYELDDDVDPDSSPPDLDIPLQRDAIVFKIIMRSTWLHNAITELDSTAPTVMTLSASATRAPFFALSASGGPFSESTVEFSIDKESDSGENPMYKDVGESGQARQPRRGKLAPTVTETFQVQPPPSKSRVTESYRFALVRKALRAMAVSSKVSIRGDRQGVLSMQFMVEHGEGAGGDGSSAGAGPTRVGGNSTDNVSFVDFRFVPLVEGESESDDELLDSL
jgi:cell cycle checkpoint protein